MHGEMVGGVSCFVQQTHTTMSEHYKRIMVKKRRFYNGKTRFPVNGLCLETKQMWLKCCVARNGDPYLKPRSFSQPQLCFHLIRLTDKML